MPDFQTAVTRVILFGTLILAIGTTGLFLVFRAFGDEHGRSRRNLLMGALIFFIASTCVLMYIVTR